MSFMPSSQERCASVMGFQAGFFFGIAFTGLTFWLIGAIQ